MRKEKKIKRILLIDPKGFGVGLNLGLGYLAAVLLNNDYRVKVLDFNNPPKRLSKGLQSILGVLWPKGYNNWKERIDKALKWRPEVIGISINSFTLDNSLAIIKYCRTKTGSRVIYLAGGPHVTMFRKDFLEKHRSLFDFAIVGEGEETIVDLLKNITNPKKVNGIIYYHSRKKQLVETEPRPLIMDLDSLPFPNFEVFDTINPKMGLYNYQLMSSRGCPFDCVFCFHMWTRRWRARSPKNILREIITAQKKFHIKTLTFWDDNFSLNLNRAKKICDLFLTRSLNITYSLAGIRADRVDEEFIKKLKQSGCQMISMGIEDGDPKTFPYVGKGENLEQITKTVRLIKKYKIPLMVYMIIGLINSSYKSFLRSLRFIEKLGVIAHWNIAFPFPNTPLYDWAKKNGRFLITLEEGFKSSMTCKNPPVIFDTVNFPKAERLKAYYTGNLRSRGYDMLVSSRSDNFFFQVQDIIEAIWKYDKQNIGRHFSILLKMFTRLVKQEDILAYD